MKILSKKMEASLAAGGLESEEHHVLPLSLYFGVFGALLVLTLVTVGVSVLGLPALYAIIVAMAVASVKAALVVLYFMHLRYDAKFYSFIFISSLFFISLFFLFTLGDMSSRGLVIPEQATDYWRQEQLAIRREKNAGQVKSSEGTPSGAPSTQGDQAPAQGGNGNPNPMENGQK